MTQTFVQQVTGKQYPFILEVQRAGAIAPSRLKFTTQEAMQKEIKSLVKNHFIGSILPYHFDGGVWLPDEQSVRMVSNGHDHTPERSTLFAQCAAHFKLLSKVKGPLSKEQNDDLVELMTSAAMYVSDVQEEEEEEVSDEGMDDPFQN